MNNKEEILDIQRNHTRFNRAFALASLMIAGALPLTTKAADAKWPDHAVKLVIPYSAGGNVDSAARIISEKLQAAFGQPFVVENKPGAGGLIAGDFVAHAAADGYTLYLGTTGTLVFSPIILRKTGYEWHHDFAPVSTISVTPIVLQVNPATPYKTVAELIAAAKRADNTLTMASPGVGTQNNLISEYLKSKTGAHWTTVQYKGNAPATTDLLGGQVTFNFDQVSVALPFIKQGKTRALAVMSAKRLPQLPEVPTMEEAGFKGFVADTVSGLSVPKKTPLSIVEQLNAALQKILADPVVRQRFEALGSTAQSSTPDQYAAFLNQEEARWVPIIKEANIVGE